MEWSTKNEIGPGISYEVPSTFLITSPLLLTLSRDVQLELEQLGKELEDMKKQKKDRDRAFAEIEHNLRSFESRKKKLRIDKQRLDDKIEKIINDIEENFADSRLGTFEAQLDVSVEVLCDTSMLTLD